MTDCRLKRLLVDEISRSAGIISKTSLASILYAAGYDDSYYLARYVYIDIIASDKWIMHSGKTVGGHSFLAADTDKVDEIANDILVSVAKYKITKPNTFDVMEKERDYVNKVTGKR